MVRAIKEDFSKIFGDYRVYLCMFGLMIVCLLSYFEMIRGQNFYNDVENGFTNLLGNEIILFCFLICIVGGSFLYCIEERHGYSPCPMFSISENSPTEALMRLLSPPNNDMFMFVLLSGILFK